MSLGVGIWDYGHIKSLELEIRVNGSFTISGYTL
jgi:hypothetical protein